MLVTKQDISGYALNLFFRMIYKYAPVDFHDYHDARKSMMENHHINFLVYKINYILKYAVLN